MASDDFEKIPDDDLFNELNGSLKTVDPSAAEDNFVARTNLKETSDENVYGGRPASSSLRLVTQFRLRTSYATSSSAVSSRGKLSPVSGCSALLGSNSVLMALLVTSPTPSPNV